MPPSLETANQYHSKRLSASDWLSETEERREQALQSAEDLLRKILKGVSAFSDDVICEQAVYMLSTAYEDRKNKLASTKLDGLSVSYHWDSSRGLLAPYVEEEFADELAGSTISCKTGGMY